MSVSEEIRKVKRPKNTIVSDSGNNSLYRYAVRERKRSVYKAGKNPSPRNGAIIGHIINGAYVPVIKKTESSIPTTLSFGSSCLIYSLCKDILDDLLKVFEPKYCSSILVIAAIKIMRPRAVTSRYPRYYESSYLSKYFPGTCLSKNYVKSLCDYLGKNGDKRIEFYNHRVDAVAADHNILIDGTLKEDNSVVNDLSNYSRKARIKGTEDISVIYAYDTDTNEPLCAKVFPGNEIDAVAYRSFIKENNITKGIIIADKGFPVSQITNQIDKNKALHYISPLKRGSSLIAKYDMYSYTGKLTGFEETILYKKVTINENKYLYSFMSQSKSKYDDEFYKKKRDEFGTIVFESDIDLPPEKVYKDYKERWTIELVFRQYKTDLELNTTRKENDYTVIGSEFINFIATLISCRILAKAVSLNLLDDESFGNLIEDLNEVWRKADAPEKAEIHDEYFEHALRKDLETLLKLGLIEDNTIKRPRGRPRTKPIENKPKRPRGRPKKQTIVQ